ncbi:MAG: hypothetical protein FJ279_17420 [Planctomycetes bacterium]|nr:hypothetical protein [Planctomycetota bacterium]
MMKRRDLLIQLVPVAACCVAWGQDILAEWGDVWQPQLPKVERHPSLFYDEADRQRMRDRTGREPWARWWRDLLKQGVRSTPAVNWWLTGDEAAARTARDDLLTRPIWRQTPQGYLEPSSHRFSDYVIAYDVLAAWPGLAAEEHERIRVTIAAEADHYYGVMCGGVPGGCNFGNQRTLAASALGMAALALCEYRDSPNGPERWLRRALYEIRRDENFWFFRPGGLFVEGAGYTDYMNVQFVQFAIAYERATGKYLFSDPRLREWLTFAAYQLMNNGELIPWGTCESGRGLGFFGLLTNARYGRDLAPLFRLAFNLPASPSLHPYHLHLALAHHDPETTGPMPPASRAFPASQTVVLRENWGHEAVAVWFAGKDGTWPLDYRYGTYSHGDSGHFVLVAWDEVLATDSGYDHWKSRDYYGAEFHNVLLIDGKGPEQNTPGELSQVVTEGPVRHATVTTKYQGCTVRRTLALVRGRYVLVADRILADAEHDYAWQVRSTCPPDSAGTTLREREVTWPGLDAQQWRDLRPGRTQLTTVVPPFVKLVLEKSRWRPMSGKPEFINQLALARCRGGKTTALFALLPNLRETPHVAWEPLNGQNLIIKGANWTDQVLVTEGELSIAGRDGRLRYRLSL